MKQNLPCEIIQDLLPTYLSKLTSPVTNEAIEEHLNTCEACSSVMAQMNRELELDADAAPDKELDYLKKLRKRKRQSLFIGVSGLLAVLLGCALFLFNYYIIGKPLDPSLLQYEAVYNEDTGTFRLTGSIDGISETVVTRVKVKPDKDTNMINILVYATDETFFNHKTTFEKEFQMEADRAVYLAGNSYEHYLIWSYESEHIETFIQIWQQIYEAAPGADWSSCLLDYLDDEILEGKDGYVFFLSKIIEEDDSIYDTGLRFFVEKGAEESGTFTIYTFSEEQPSLAPLSGALLEELVTQEVNQPME